MKVIAYVVTGTPDKLRIASSKKKWMDDAVNKNPYRCLPLSMANSWGWEILSSAKFTATWNGGVAASDVKIEVHEGSNAPIAHFGEGTLTWHAGYVFSTPYPYGMYMGGAPNNPKPNAIALSGIIETHWLPYTATMNWRFTQPGSFTMEIGEPYCQIFPVDMNMFDVAEPEIRTMSEDQQFYDLYWDWNISRSNYMMERSVPGTDAHDPDEWQRHYFQGRHPKGKVYPEGSKCPFHTTDAGEQKSTHRTKPNVPEFVDKQTEPFKTIADYNERTKAIREVYDNYMKQLREKENRVIPMLGGQKTEQPVIERSPEEIQQRIEHHKQILREKSKQLNGRQCLTMEETKNGR